ncbi:MAG: hypothetical protein AAB795_02875 [Patescibacteria group bacterium]
MNKKGVTLLLAVLVSSIALSVGIGIFSLLFSEIEISGSAKDSVIAFYAADSGLECALYWELLENKDTSISSPFSMTGESPIPITCNDASPYFPGFGTCGAESSSYCVGEFYPQYTGDTVNSCAHVMVEKQMDSETGIIQTRLIADGENRSQCNTTPSSLRIVQRSGGYVF